MFFFFCVFGLFTGLFPMLAHGALLRLTRKQRRWTRWIVPALVAMWMGTMLLSPSNPMFYFHTEWYWILFVWLIWEGQLLLCTRYMEQNSN